MCVDTSLISRKATFCHLGIGASCFQEKVRSGIFTPAVKIGSSCLWPAYEVRIFARAIIAGYDDDQLKQLTQSLLLARKSPELLSGIAPELIGG